jgi:pimeloyl-ACP methyl ester carboxylesterase
MVVGVTAEDHINRIIEQGHFLIRDAALSNKKLFMLLDNDVNITVLIIDSGTGEIISETPICRIDAALASLFPGLIEQISRGPRSHSIEIGLQLSSKSETTGVLFKNDVTPSDHLVVYFHGGPAQTVNPYELGREKAALLDDGFDLLMVEYSGSVGGGLALSRGLQADEFLGFKQDAKAIREWLQTQNYESVHLYAVSFGTLPALILASEFPEEIDKKVFVSPLLKHAGTSSLEKSGELLVRTAEGGQEDFEIGLFGGERGRQRYLAFIERTVSNYRPDARDLFIFGSADRITPMSSAPNNIIESANVYQIDKVGHSFLASDQNTIDRVRCHFRDECVR